MRKHIEEETKVGGGISVLSEVMGAQEIVSFGYGSQSRETMEVEDCYSAKSECYGAFERRRETSTMADFKADIKREIASAMAEQLREIKAMLAGMMMNQNRSTTGGTRMNQNQSARVLGTSETTGKVEYFFRMTSGDEQMRDGDEILGGDANEDDSSVSLKGRDEY